MKYKTVIFDLDGTLLNTLDDIADSVNHTMRKLGLPEASLAEVRARVGNGSARLIELCVPGGRDGALFGTALADYSAWYDAHCRIKTRPYPGVPELVEALGRDGTDCAVVSNKPDTAVRELNRVFFRGLMKTAVGERDGVRRKPAPDSVLRAMEELGAEKSSTVYIGDSEVDVMTAKNAGVDCITVLWGFRDKDELAAHGATRFASDADELLRLLEGADG